jgi:putative hydrolase of the HAD superfamily
MNRGLPTSVFFDLDDTLYEYLPCHRAGLSAAVTLMSSKLNISKREAEAIYENGRRQVKSRLGETASSHSRLLYFREGLISIGLGRESTVCLDFENRYWTHFLFEMKIRDGAKNLISSLKYAKIPIFLVTDLTDQIQLRKIVRLKLEETFDEIISSELSGADKVTGKPFEILFNALAPKILDIPIFIGDSIQDFPNLKNFVNPQKSIMVKNFCFSRIEGSHTKIEKVKNFQEIESQIFETNE